jgi:hypothetical protein
MVALIEHFFAFGALQIFEFLSFDRVNLAQIYIWRWMLVF